MFHELTTQLDRIERKLDTILHREHEIMADDTALMNAVGKLNDKLTVISTAITAIEDSGVGTTNAAVQAEIDKIKLAVDGVSTHADEVVVAAQAGVPTPPAPPAPPADTGTGTDGSGGTPAP